MLPQLSIIKRAALDLFFPQRCLGCGEEGILLCRLCQRSMLRIMPPVCPRCGKPQPSGILCPVCIGRQTAIDGIRSPFKFHGVMREAVHQFKYRNLRSLAGPLAGLLKDYIEANPLPGDTLAPVPLHPLRFRERGYNQAYLLARELGKMIGLPVIGDCLTRVKHSQPQVKTLSADERRRNVSLAFSCNDSRARDRKIILIDDVSTSGATLEACAAALKSAGAASVWGLVVAREI